jgi:hypothetical protein
MQSCACKPLASMMLCQETLQCVIPIGRMLTIKTTISPQLHLTTLFGSFSLLVQSAQPHVDMKAVTKSRLG